jgi:RNase P subunit RPR2
MARAIRAIRDDPLARLVVDVLSTPDNAYKLDDLADQLIRMPCRRCHRPFDAVACFDGRSRHGRPRRYCSGSCTWCAWAAGVIAAP